MNDKELLELAAKAAEIVFVEVDGIGLVIQTGSHNFCHWNPLTDDGDALRLAVKLKIECYFEAESVDIRGTPPSFDDEPYNNDPYAATRRAIVRAAAEVGRWMK